MSFISSLLAEMERSTAGSEATARAVMELCKKPNGGKALFFGDDYFTPRLIAENTKADVTAAFYEDFRTEKARQLGLSAHTVGAYEVMQTDGGWDLLWFNGCIEPDGVDRRLEQLKLATKRGGTVVYRTLCWLIDPSPDTRSYVQHRFGNPERLDSVIPKAKEQGFKVMDFVISPKTDWTKEYYAPLDELVKKLEGENSEIDGEARSGIGELNKDMYMFNLHSEEYSFVYYIMES